MWECLDFFPLDGKWALILPPIEMERQQENIELKFDGCLYR